LTAARRHVDGCGVPGRPTRRAPRQPNGDGDPFLTVAGGRPRATLTARSPVVPTPRRGHGVAFGIPNPRRGKQRVGRGPHQRSLSQRQAPGAGRTRVPPSAGRPMDQARTAGMLWVGEEPGGIWGRGVKGGTGKAEAARRGGGWMERGCGLGGEKASKAWGAFSPSTPSFREIARGRAALGALLSSRMFSSVGICGRPRWLARILTNDPHPWSWLMVPYSYVHSGKKCRCVSAVITYHHMYNVLVPW
jgi:hypothetical protein